MLSRLARRLIRVTGYPQEYLCLAADGLDNTFLWTIDDAPIDPHHILFLGYRPCVLGIPEDIARPTSDLRLRHGGKDVARMRLSRMDGAHWPGIALMHGEPVHQQFLPPVLDQLDRIRQRINMRNDVNVTKELNEYDALRIGYAHPREVHLAVVGTADHCNIFPTDLHGSAEEGSYLISLRHAGKACAQVQQSGRMLLCRQQLTAFREVYQLGKRHMVDAGPAERITTIDRSVEGYPVPASTTSFSSLALQDHVDIGIHRLFRFSILQQGPLKEAQVLAHAHAGPMGYLKRQGLAPDVLLR